MRQVLLLIREAWILIRFGKITHEVRGTVNGVAAEIEYYGRNGKPIGYWAYGHFDPGMPYQGD